MFPKVVEDSSHITLKEYFDAADQRQKEREAKLTTLGARLFLLDGGNIGGLEFSSITLCRALHKARYSSFGLT